MQAMLEREAARPLTGLVQLDDAYSGGRRRGYKLPPRPRPCHVAS